MGKAIDGSSRKQTQIGDIMIEPSYECVVQYLTFYGKSLSEVLRNVADYIEQNKGEVSTPEDGVIEYSMSEDCEYSVSFHYDYKHIKFSEIQTHVQKGK